jgi:Protein of unknown function (DUF1579)
MQPTLAAGPIQKEAIVKRMTVLLAVCTMFLATSLQAQAPQGPPKPGPEVKKLDYNIGTWNVEGEAKPFGPMPGGKFTATEKCEWYSGGFFVVCHSEGAGPMGPAKGVSFMGYDPNEKVYTYHEFGWATLRSVCASPSRKYPKPSTRSSSRCRRMAESFRSSRKRQVIR